MDQQATESREQVERWAGYQGKKEHGGGGSDELGQTPLTGQDDGDWKLPNWIQQRGVTDELHKAAATEREIRGKARAGVKWDGWREATDSECKRLFENLLQKPGVAVGGGDGDQGVLFVSFKRMDVYILIGAIQQRNKRADIEERGGGGGSGGGSDGGRDGTSGGTGIRYHLWEQGQPTVRAPMLGAE